jgi:hypothetical protein
LAVISLAIHVVEETLPVGLLVNELTSSYVQQSSV